MLSTLSVTVTSTSFSSRPDNSAVTLTSLAVSLISTCGRKPCPFQRSVDDRPRKSSNSNVQRVALQAYLHLVQVAFRQIQTKRVALVLFTKIHRGGGGRAL